MWKNLLERFMILNFKGIVKQGFINNVSHKRKHVILLLTPTLLFILQHGIIYTKDVFASLSIFANLPADYSHNLPTYPVHLINISSNY